MAKRRQKIRNGASESRDRKSSLLVSNEAKQPTVELQNYGAEIGKIRGEGPPIYRLPLAIQSLEQKELCSNVKSCFNLLESFNLVRVNPVEWRHLQTLAITNLRNSPERWFRPKNLRRTG